MKEPATASAQSGRQGSAVVAENEIKVLRFMSGMSVDQRREPDGNTLAFLYGQHVGLEAIHRREVL
jgi:hypothetical protein